LPGVIDDLAESTDSHRSVWSTTDHSSGNANIDKRPSGDGLIRPHMAGHRCRAQRNIEANPPP
jgi:hypothetical protein